MKVILLKDVKAQGRQNDVIEVSDGYARNFLIKKGLAVAADASNLNEVRQRVAADEKKRELEKQEAQELAGKLDGQTLTMGVRCGDKGKTYGSITAKEIADNLSSQGYAVDKKKIVLKDNIRNVGVYAAEIKVYPGISAKVNLNIVPIE